MRSLHYRSFLALLCAFVMTCKVVGEENEIRYLRQDFKGGTRNLSKGKGGSSSSISSKSSKSLKSSKSPGGKGAKSSKYPKGKGGKGHKSSKSPKSFGKGGDASKSSKSYGKGKGGKGSKSSKSSKSVKSAKSSKSPKSSKSSKADSPTSLDPNPPSTSSPVGSKPSPSPTKKPAKTSSPTKAPVASPPTICGRTEEQRVEFITDLVSSLTASNVLNDLNSPQARASQWLINDDPIALCPDSNAQIVQRFSLAAFYYSTNGDRWSFCGAANGPCPTDAQRFLSNASECDWYGIVCNANGRVLDLKLETLDGQDINLNGILPPEIFLMPKIRDVEIDFSDDDPNRRGRLSGSLPATIGQSNQIRALDIQSQNISGEIPDAFYLSTLREVDLDNNRLTGTISSNVQNMRNLIFFTASNNPFSPQQIPAGFGNIPELRFLGLNNANLIGPVPNALSNLREIRSIDFSDNDLTGDISFLRNYNFLQSIALDNNRLSGDIPAEFWQKTSLQIANLENNQLTGQIPPSIGTMTELRTLRLAGNNMSGTIPLEIANLTNLRVLTLEGNNFTGSLPAALCELRFLETVTVPASIECPRFCCVRIP